MKLINIESDLIPQIEELQFLPISKVKTGGRTEHIIKDISKYRELGRKYTSLPLRFVSIIKANKGYVDQNFHKDNNEGLRIFIYLTDVENEDSGAIDFTSGPVIGKRGTGVIYSAGELHRGLANNSSSTRWGLAMAFSSNNNKIKTIGVTETVQDYSLYIIVFIILISIIFIVIIQPLILFSFKKPKVFKII
jgi:hypothetical protein